MQQAITLTESDLTYLKLYKNSGPLSLRQYNRLNILMLLHRGKKSIEIEDFLGVDRVTIWRTKKKFLEQGLQKALQEDQRSGQPVKYTTDQQAVLSAMACGPCPAGRRRWTIRLLTDECRKRPGLETISRESVRLMLKKMHVSLG